MRHAKAIQTILLLLLAAPLSHAQMSDWNVVKNIPFGSDIRVKAGHRTRCVFRSATDEQLVCDRSAPPYMFGYRIPPYAFDRADVQEVSLQHSNAANKFAGAAIGAGAGAILGYSLFNANTGYTRGATTIFDSAFGGFVGAFAGGYTHFLGGHVIYKR